jgi:ribosomal protein S18 acetylase RimI-like enzyme
MVERSANSATALPTDPGTQIRAVGEEFVPSALLILREASQWLARRGLSGWSDLELQNTDFPRHCAAGALILGFEGESPVACMLLQREDPIYWPKAVPGSALYLHKLAVRRAQAGRGWGARMVTWAKTETQRLRIEHLRLDTWADSRLSEFYSRHGFHLVDRLIKPEDGMVMCRMECRLTCKHL